MPPSIPPLEDVSDVAAPGKPPGAATAVTTKRIATADAFFAIGRSHTICEDYALAGSEPSGGPYAIVADGCSSAPDADIGARLLARAARRALLTAPNGLRPEQVVQVAWQWAIAQGLPQRSLDATLLVAQRDGDRLRVTMAGDGTCAVRYRDGSWGGWSVVFDDGAPPYPSYGLEPARRAAYLATRPSRRLVVHGPSTLTHASPARWVQHDRTADELAALWVEHELASDDVELVLLLSDGVQSFCREVRSSTSRHFEPVPAEAVVPHLLAVRGLTGRFMVRRGRRFLTRTCLERGWQHEDDLAMAALGFRSQP